MFRFGIRSDYEAVIDLANPSLSLLPRYNLQPGRTLTCISRVVLVFLVLCCSDLSAIWQQVQLTKPSLVISWYPPIPFDFRSLTI
jgi:hypothetical protein